MYRALGAGVAGTEGCVWGNGGQRCWRGRPGQGTQDLLSHVRVFGLYLTSKAKPLTCFKEQVCDITKVKF